MFEHWSALVEKVKAEREQRKQREKEQHGISRDSKPNKTDGGKSKGNKD